MIGKILLILILSTTPILAASHSSKEAALLAQGAYNGLKIEANVAFTEGPAWHSPSQSVFFTDIENNRIMRRDRLGQLHVFRSPATHANGLAFDHQNRLIACQGGVTDAIRGLTRTELDGTITTLTDNFNGAKYNSPNDLAIDSKSRIYFTDPRYGPREDMEILDEKGKPIEGVYRIDPDGFVEQILTHEIHRPNGIAISADERFLFVADNASGQPNGNRKMWRFNLAKDGKVDPASRMELFDWRTRLGIDRGPDGMAIGKDGNLYVTAGWNFHDQPVEVPRQYKAGIYVIDPNGRGLIRFIPIPIDDITNCTFGGPEGNTLFVTAGHRLFSIEIE